MSSAMTDEEILDECSENFFAVATLQGRLAYLLMSVHAVNPAIFAYFSSYDPHRILFANMLYGIGANVFCRPSMAILNPLHRFAFSLLGSMMFNHSSMMVYGWLVERLPHRPYLLTLSGFLCGRIMIVHLLAYLYHVDNRSMLPGVRRSSAYDGMYI